MAVNSFDAQESRIAVDGQTNGSKVILAWERSQRWTQDPPTVDDPTDLTATITYPKRDGSGGFTTATEVITCRDARIRETTTHVLVECHFDGDIHDVDAAEFNAPQGWLKNANAPVDESEALVDRDDVPNHSEVDYPKPIVSWDMIPHQVFDGEFHIDLQAFHRYSYPNSPYGDLDVKIKVQSVANPNVSQELSANPTAKASERSGYPTYQVYRATFDATTFSLDGNYDVSFKITPARGDADSVRESVQYDDLNFWLPEASGRLSPILRARLTRILILGTLLQRFSITSAR